MTEQKSDDLRMGALYIRVSTHEQDELSPDAQKRLLLDYAKSNGIVVQKDAVFVESVSGRNVKKRKEFQRMIAQAKSPEHPYDVILVWKFSRFARNQEESIVYKSMLKKDRVDVISVSEPVIDGPFGSLIERIIEWMDEYYSIRLSGEVLRGMGEKALKQGYQISPPLGYDAVGDGKPYKINEKEFKIVSYIMSQYDDYCQDTTAIARKCNDLGYRTKRGNLFERRNIDYILRNPFYAGIVNWNGQTFEGTHEARYTTEQLDKRIKLMNARRRPAKHRNASTCKHWLSGLIKCSICGATLSYTGSGACPYFQCWKYAKGYHKTSVAISVKKMEQLVIDYLKQLLDGADFQYVPKTTAPAQNGELEQLKQELARLSTRELRIKLAYENEIDTLEEYKENKIRLQKQRESLLENIKELEAQKPEDPSRDNVLSQIRSVYDVLLDPAAESSTKGNFIRTIVDQIVFDKEAEMVYFDIII